MKNKCKFIKEVDEDSFDEPMKVQGFGFCLITTKDSLGNNKGAFRLSMLVSNQDETEGVEYKEFLKKIDFLFSVNEFVDFISSCGDKLIEIQKHIEDTEKKSNSKENLTN